MNGIAQAAAPLCKTGVIERRSSPAAHPRGLRAAWVRWWPLFCPWPIAALMSTSQVYYLWQQKEHEPLSFWSAFVWQGAPWGFWLFATPVLVWLGRRFPLERGIWQGHAAIHLAANLALAPGHLALAVVLGRAAGQTFYLTTPFASVLRVIVARNVHLEVLIYWGVIALLHASEYRRRFREREIVAAQLETKLAQAELSALRMQLHPHFLFNTLHAIAVLVRKQDTQASVRMLTGLSDLLRLALENAGRQVVPIKQELDFLNRYLEIEKTRFHDRLAVRVDIAPEALDAEIPNLILQPLVENAIRHGIAPRSAAGCVEIRARRQGPTLVVQVQDDGRGLKESWDGGTSTGMGLRNVRARLDQLYPGNHRFSIEPHPGGGVLVTLAIPFRPARGEASDG